MASKTLKDLFVHSLSDVYSAEKQLTKALPKMARAATNSKLKALFESHLEETRGQILRLDQVIESFPLLSASNNGSQIFSWQREAH